MRQERPRRNHPTLPWEAASRILPLYCGARSMASTTFVNGMFAASFTAVAAWAVRNANEFLMPMLTARWEEEVCSPSAVPERAGEPGPAVEAGAADAGDQGGSMGVHDRILPRKRVRGNGARSLPSSWTEPHHAQVARQRPKPERRASRE